MGKGKLKQNGVHLHDHEYATVKLFLEYRHDIELILVTKSSGILDFSKK